ncbi:MAG: hypothetical protein RLZZ373_1230 [Pseudomonadota bacterium]
MSVSSLLALLQVMGHAKRSTPTSAPALKWRHGRHGSRAYPTTDAMAETLVDARGDGRIAAGLSAYLMAYTIDT